MSKIRVLIVDDHAVLRSGLRMLINAQADMEVVGEAPATSEALAATREIQPDIVTLDLSMPGGGGLKFLEQARTEGLKARTVVLTMHDDPAYFRSAISAGALGYVVKTAADNELLTAIRAVNDGRLFVSMPGGKQDELLDLLGRRTHKQRDRRTIGPERKDDRNIPLTHCVQIATAIKS